MTSNMDFIRAWPLDGLAKGGSGTDRSPCRWPRAGDQGWNVARGDLSLPVLTLRDARFRHNLHSMRPAH